MNLNMVYDFMQLLNINRKHPTKNEYFSRHDVFTIICLLQDQKLNPRNYSEQKLNVINFS
jgi:hypothetical protein